MAHGRAEAPHLSGITPFAPIYPGWDVPNTNGIPQAWSAVIVGYTSGRSLNTGFIDNAAYWQGKMLEQYAGYRPFSELDEAIGIAPDDWWMADSAGLRKSFMKTWLDHVGDRAFNLAAEPAAKDYAAMRFPILTATGFFDDDQPGALRYYRSYFAHAPTAQVDRSVLVIGPWDHGGTQRPAKSIMGLTIPDSAVLDMQALHAGWCDWISGAARSRHCCATRSTTSCWARTSGATPPRSRPRRRASRWASIFRRRTTRR